MGSHGPLGAKPPPTFLGTPFPSDLSRPLLSPLAVPTVQEWEAGTAPWVSAGRGGCQAVGGRAGLEEAVPVGQREQEAWL